MLEPLPMTRNGVPQPGFAGAIRAADAKSRAIADSLEKASPLVPAWLMLFVFSFSLVRGGWPVIARPEALLTGVLVALGFWGRSRVEGRERHPLIADLSLWVAMAPGFILVADASRRAADGRFDAAMASMDLDLFGISAPLWFASKFPSRWFHEWLEFAYFTYYLWIPAPGLLGWLAGPRARIRAVLALSVSYTLTTGLELILATKGPLADRATTVMESGPMKTLVDWVYRFDAHGGAAFPSSHVAVGTVGWWMVYCRHRMAGLLTFPIIVSMWFATLQGSFHYLVDVPAGLLVTVLALALVRPGVALEPGAPQR